MSVNDAEENKDPKVAFKHMLDMIDEVINCGSEYVSSPLRIRLDKLEDAKARWMRLEVEWAENRAKVQNPFRDLPAADQVDIPGMTDED